MEANFGIDLEAVRATRRRKEERRSAILDARFAQATADLGRIVERIVDRHDPLRIWQWGSLLDRRRFTEISDIDIAVEGVDTPEAWFALLGDVMAISGFPLDLVDLGHIQGDNADYIRRTGKVLYERKR
jgi:predicted nucleotidyltransferase